MSLVEVLASSWEHDEEKGRSPPPDAHEPGMLKAVEVGQMIRREGAWAWGVVRVLLPVQSQQGILCMHVKLQQRCACHKIAVHM